MNRVLRAVVESFKYIMNGAHLPNWAKLIVIVLIIMAIYAGQFFTAGELAKAARVVTVRQANTQLATLVTIRSDIAEMREELQEEMRVVAMRDSLRAKRLERKVDHVNARIDDMNTYGTDGTNERLDELIRTLQVRQRKQQR